MCSINGKNRVMVDLMRPKRGLGGPSAEVTSTHEKKQGESNGESLCVFIVTCLANKQGWLVYCPWQEQCFLLLCIWGSNADGWMEKWMDRWMDGWGLSADGERTKHQCDRMRKADLCARWAWTWTSPFRAQNPRGEDLVVLWRRWRWKAAETGKPQSVSFAAILKRLDSQRAAQHESHLQPRSQPEHFQRAALFS